MEMNVQKGLSLPDSAFDLSCKASHIFPRRILYVVPHGKHLQAFTLGL